MMILPALAYVASRSSEVYIGAKGALGNTGRLLEWTLSYCLTFLPALPGVGSVMVGMVAGTLQAIQGQDYLMECAFLKGETP